MCWSFYCQGLLSTDDITKSVQGLIASIQATNKTFIPTECRRGTLIGEYFIINLNVVVFCSVIFSRKISYQTLCENFEKNACMHENWILAICFSLILISLKSYFSFILLYFFNFQYFKGERIETI